MSGIKIGDFDLGDKVLDHEYKIRLLTKLLEWIVNNNTLKGPTPEELKKIRDDIILEIKELYPKLDIKYTE